MTGHHSDSISHEAYKVAELQRWISGSYFGFGSTVVTTADVDQVFDDAVATYRRLHGEPTADNADHLYDQLLKILANARYRATRRASALWRECSTQWTDKAKCIPHPPCAVFDHYVTPDDVSSIVETE